MRAQWSLVHQGVTFCHSKLEHFTSDHWLISHSAILLTQIIIWLYLESEHSWFSPASLLLLWCDKVFQDAHCCWWQEDALSGSDCPSSVQSRRFDLRWGDGIFPDTIINSWTHFHDWLYYFGFYIHFYSSLMVSFLFHCINVYMWTLVHKYWASCSTIVWPESDISYTLFSNHSLIALMHSGVQYKDTKEVYSVRTEPCPNNWCKD